MLSPRFNRYYDRLRLPPSPPLTSRLFTGYKTTYGSIGHADRWAGEGLPCSRCHLPYVPRSLRRRVHRRCTSRIFTSSMAFTLRDGARLSLIPPNRAGTFTARQASLHAADRMVAPPKGALDTGLRPDPFPDRAASLLPGSLTTTRTGLTPAGNNKHTNSVISPHQTTSSVSGRTPVSRGNSAAASC